MAEGFARALLPKDWRVYSAGIRADGLNKYAVRVMKEIGIDISSQRSKTLAEIKDVKPDIVVTLCDNAEKACPTHPVNVTKMHWGLDDPADATGSDEDILAVYRRVRDEIKKRLEHIDFK
jgi:arsenate reductase